MQIPAEVQEWIQKANTYKATGAYDEASRLWENILAWAEENLGPKHLDTASSLNNLAGLYVDQGAYAKAEPLYIRALAITEETLGEKHPSTATSLNNLAFFYDAQGAYAKAEALFVRALAIAEEVHGPGDVQTAKYLNNLGLLYQATGALSKAEKLLVRAVANTETALGPNHLSTANSYNSLAGLYAHQGSFDEAIRLFARALAIRENLLGPDHLETVNSVNNLATLYDSKGQFEEAEQLYLRALSIRTQVLGRNHLDTASSLDSLGVHYQDVGAYSKAEPLLEEALSIRVATLGPSHHLIAVSLNNLASLRYRQAAYTEAERLYRRALVIRETSLGTSHPSTAVSLNNLAALYEAQGAVSKSEELYRRALAIREISLGHDHPLTASSLNNLAVLYADQGELMKAENHYSRSLAIIDKSLGPNHLQTAQTLNNLALLSQAQGATAKALTLLSRALNITEASVGADHPDTGNALNNLALLYDQKGDYANAQSYYIRALSILDKALGQYHPSTANTLNNLALLYEAQGSYGRAEPLLRRSIVSNSRFLQEQLPLMPQATREQQMQALGDAWEIPFAGADRSPSSSELALFSRLNRYGLLLEIERRQALLLRAPGPQREVAEQVAALTAQLTGSDLPAERRQALQQRREDLERELYRALPELQPRIIEPTELASALPQGAVYLAFQRYRPFDGREPSGQRRGDPHYLALVLQADGDTRGVELGPAQPIDERIAEALQITRSSGSTPQEINAAWDAVNQKLFPPPVLAELRGARSWVISPDGEISRVPFLAIPSPLQSSGPDQRLAQSIDLQLVSSGRELVPDSNRQQRVTPSLPLVVADPAFGPAKPGQEPWSRLVASADEGIAIASLLGVSPHLQQEASKEKVTTSTRPKVLHIASHGYFAAPSNTPAPAPKPATGAQLRSSLSGPADPREDAMLNSAIVLAGANSDPDDGTLTAREAAQLQLDGTELVVLSACETALGEQRSGEGVYGLQRALSVAGARSTLLSLWKVPDDGTSLFMERYYELLKQGQGRLEALQQVQAEFRDPETTPCSQCSDARYWAAWQLSGETGPVAGL